MAQLTSLIMHSVIAWIHIRSESSLSSLEMNRLDVVCHRKTGQTFCTPHREIQLKLHDPFRNLTNTSQANKTT